MNKWLIEKKNALLKYAFTLQDLIDDLKYELTGKFERLIVGLMRPPAYHDAKEIKDAIKVYKNLDSVWIWDFQLKRAVFGWCNCTKNLLCTKIYYAWLAQIIVFRYVMVYYFILHLYFLKILLFADI